jgi:serine/threonine protein kinase HipA of HipAB toxin-antitoxin module
MKYITGENKLYGKTFQNNQNPEWPTVHIIEEHDDWYVARNTRNDEKVIFKSEFKNEYSEVQ